MRLCSGITEECDANFLTGLSVYINIPVLFIFAMAGLIYSTITWLQ